MKFTPKKIEVSDPIAVAVHPLAVVFLPIAEEKSQLAVKEALDMGI